MVLIFHLLQWAVLLPPVTHRVKYWATIVTKGEIQDLLERTLCNESSSRFILHLGHGPSIPLGLNIVVIGDDFL